MSGIASAASTIPGSVATFCSCSSERSRTIAARSSSSANTRAGTRMSGRASAGISYSVSSMRRGSDIEHDPSVPHAVLACELQAVIRRRLDERVDTTTPPDERRCERRSAEPQPLCALRHEALRVGEEDQLLEPATRSEPRSSAAMLTTYRTSSPPESSATSSPKAATASSKTRSSLSASIASSMSAVWLRHSYTDEHVCGAAGDEALEHVLDRAQRPVREVDLDVVPVVQPERARPLVGAEAEQRLGGEDVAPAGPAACDSLELAQFFQRVDAYVRVGADADADAARAHALDREEAVPEIRLRRRAGADARSRAREQVELVAVGVRRMYHRRALAQAPGAAQRRRRSRPHAASRPGAGTRRRSPGGSGGDLRARRPQAAARSGSPP